jgi:hypothetical protein
LTGAGSTTADRRKRPRLATAVSARYMLANRQEYRGTVIDVSASGLVLLGSHTPDVGEKVVVYIDQDIGRVEGNVVRYVRGGFAIQFRLPSRTAEVLARMVGRALT